MDGNKVGERDIASAPQVEGAATHWSADLRTEWATFSLHPPIAFDIERRDDAFHCLLPYASGVCDLSIGDGSLRRTRLRAGAIWFLEPGVKLRLRSIEPVEFLLLTIDPSRFHALADAAAPGRAWIAHELSNHLDPALAMLAHEIRRALLADTVSPPPYLQSLADAVQTRLLCHFLGEITKGARDQALSPAVLSRVVRHIDDNLSSGLAVEDLAGLAQLTRSHFTRAFQSMTGEPPQRFVLKRRVCRARDLLSAGTGTLAEIAASAGFSSQAHMTTVFRKEIGTTPGEYRSAFGERGNTSDLHAPSTGS